MSPATTAINKVTFMLFIILTIMRLLGVVIDRELNFNPLTLTCFAFNLHKSNFAKISKNNCNAQ